MRSGRGPSGRIPTGALLTGAIPPRAFPTGSLSTRALPAGSLPTGALPARPVARRARAAGVTAQIVKLLTGDQEFDSAKTLSAFGLGLTLFVVTLILNIIALRIVQKYREQYD